MRLINLEKVPNNQVAAWLTDNIPDLTMHQASRLRDGEMLRSAPFDFYRRGVRTTNILWRISFIFLAVLLLIMYIGLPVNYLVTGNWGYSHKIYKWVTRWSVNCGINSL